MILMHQKKSNYFYFYFIIGVCALLPFQLINAALEDAILENNAIRVKDLIEATHPDLNRKAIAPGRLHNGVPLIEFAAKHGKLRALQALIEGGAEWKNFRDAEGNTILHLALSREHNKQESEDKDFIKPVVFLIREGGTEILQAKNNERKTPLLAFLYNKKGSQEKATFNQYINLTILKAFFEHDITWKTIQPLDGSPNLLHHAIKCEQTDLARELIKNGIDLNRGDYCGWYRPIDLAVQLISETGDDAILNFLQKKDPQQLNYLTTSEDSVLYNLEKSVRNRVERLLIDKYKFDVSKKRTNDGALPQRPAPSFLPTPEQHSNAQSQQDESRLKRLEETKPKLQGEETVQSQPSQNTAPQQLFPSQVEKRELISQETQKILPNAPLPPDQQFTISPQSILAGTLILGTISLLLYKFFKKTGRSQEANNENNAHKSLQVS